MAKARTLVQRAGQILSRFGVDPHAAFAVPHASAPINGRLLLHDLASPINIGMILRVAETYRMPVAVFDPRGVVKGQALSTISDFACGALERLGVGHIEEEADLLRVLSTGRIVGTAIEPPTVPLPEFVFSRSDIILIGGEYDGLPPELLERTAVNVTIPMCDVWTPKPRSVSPIDPSRTKPVRSDGTPSLNAAMSAVILAYHAFRQIGVV
jgi:tRNA G18 (ribose-2'-O)-methylase SpoU